ncbi:MAG: YraN family protein [Gammaproteobacteria bacterium]|nr:YraN family protein [Gammaproteobacteria bacterium]
MTLFASNTITRGEEAETAACVYLNQRGLTTLERNFRCRHGEIDLIMRQDEVIVFVEVRSRRSSGFSSPAETIDRRKQRKVIATAQYYLNRLKRHPDPPCRFDVIAITGISPHHRVEWIEDAFH